MTLAGRWARRAARAVIPAPLLPVLREQARQRGLLAAPPFRYPFREILLQQGLQDRPHYRWGTLNAALMARTLGYPHISVIEFGVAGGNGLLALERIAAEVQAISGVGIEVYGFDTGTGLTKPEGHRDLPQLWKEGDYGMDVAGLRKRLTRAQLVLGPVAETVPKFLAGDPAPVGFVVFDLDLYSSTRDAFALLDAPQSRLLPRVMAYFDDIIGFSHGDFSGERLAIREFNDAHEQRKISQQYGLRHVLHIDQWWTEQMYLFNDFAHPRYNDFDGSNSMHELPLHD